MQPTDIIFCENFGTEIEYLLNNSYKLQKIMLITTTFLYQKFESKINTILKCNCTLKIAKLPNNAVNNLMFNTALNAYWEENITLIIVLGSGNLCDLVKAFATTKNVPILLVPSMASSGGYLLNFVQTFNGKISNLTHVCVPIMCLVDGEIISKTSNTFFAGCLGGVLGYFTVMLDLIFNNQCLNHNISISTIKQLNSELKPIYSLPPSAFKTNKGKTLLFKTLLSLDVCLQNFQTIPTVFLLTNTLTMLTKYTVNYGALNMYSAVMLSKIFNVFFNTNFANFYFTPNIEKRIKKFAAVFGNLASINLKNYEFEFGNLFKSFARAQPCLCVLANKFLNIVIKSFEEFKNLHNDKGVFLTKTINYNLITNAISLTPDLYAEINLLTVMRNLGALDLNI